ncbi:MAG: hypothetical protein ACI8WP_001577 [Flavobacteriaceae bacterium]|jgi:uncharacterized protein (DUF2147 family)
MTPMKKNVSTFILVVALNASGYSQDISGLWKTIDDKTGKPRSIVKIEARDGNYVGTIKKLFREPNEVQDPICEVCPDDRKNQKVIGMEIIKDMKFNKRENIYEDGEILDPESGSVYDCKIWLDESSQLQMRGYIMFLYRTQTWLPVDEDN